MQFLIRSDDDLALIEGRRRLAGQRDSVIANDIDTHGWGLLICPTAGAAGDPHSRSLCRAKPVYSGQSYGNYWASVRCRSPAISGVEVAAEEEFEPPGFSMLSAADTSSQCLGNTADIRCTLVVGLCQKDRQLGQQTAIGLLAYGSPSARTPARPPLPIRRQHRHHCDRDLTSKTHRRWCCETKTRSGRQVERRLSDRLRDLHRGDLQRARCAESSRSRNEIWSAQVDPQPSFKLRRWRPRCAAWAAPKHPPKNSPPASTARIAASPRLRVMSPHRLPGAGPTAIARGARRSARS